MNSPATIGLGVLGASKFAAFCLDAYAGLPNVRPIAVASRTRSSAEGIATPRGLAVRSIDELLADPAIHLIHIATLPSEHAALASKAIAAGKHVLLEKPIATDVAGAESLVALAESRGVVLAINHMMRFGPLASAVERILRDRLLGAPLRAYVVNTAGDDGLPPEHWFWDESLSGGIFVEHAVHFFDLLASWFGDGSLLHAHQSRRDGGVVDQATAEVKYGPELTANHYHGFTQSHHLDRQCVTVICERGTIELIGWVAGEISIRGVADDDGLTHLRDLFPDDATIRLRRLDGNAAFASRRLRRQPLTQSFDLTWTDSRDGQVIYAAALRDLMTDVLASIRDKRPPKVSGESCLAPLRLAAAAREAARRLA